jgi:hypothetical protein
LTRRAAGAHAIAEVRNFAVRHLDGKAEVVAHVGDERLFGAGERWPGG